MTKTRDQVFISYCHEDLDYLKRLKVHLKPFEREELIKTWSDLDIHASQIWFEEIKSALQKSAVAILLISADFLASEFINNEELPNLLSAAQEEGVKILPFILKPCSFTSTNLGKYQAVNKPDKSHITLDEAQREQDWVNLAKTTKETLDEYKREEEAAEAVKRDAGLPHNKIKWDKVATLFWLSNDLMWIQDRLYRAAPVRQVLDGIYKTLQYAEDLGFAADSLPIQNLLIAKELAQAVSDSSSSAEGNKLVVAANYKNILHYIEPIKWYLSQLATLKQGEFTKLK